MHDYVSDNKIKENKYKILRMSLLLGADENRDETVANFEDAARDIDAMNDEVYLRDLSGKFYDTSNLEDEEKKLDVLVNYIDGRVEQRISLLTDFANVTGFDLQNLPPIKYYDKLDDYKDRLKYIREYLNNIHRIEVLDREISDDNTKLEIAYKNKKASEEFNLRSEEMLYNKFLQLSKKIDYFNDINEDNVSEYLDKVLLSVNDSKKSLDIFNKSFQTLLHSGIGSDEEHEYRSYVVSAQDAYYSNKEKEYLIRLYQYVIQREKEYNSIVVKRDCIHDLLSERLSLRKEFSIRDYDVLEGIYDLLERQYQDISSQKSNIESIDNLQNDISLKNDEKSDLELDNQKVEILAILREYSIVDSYNNNSLDNIEQTSDNIEDSSLDNVVDDVSDENLNDDIFNNSQELTNYDEEKSFDEEVLDKDEDNSNIFDDNNNEVQDDEIIEEEVVDSQDDSSDIVDESPEEVLDNQVVSVSDEHSLDLDLVHSKANKVMQRVGEMLGIKPKEEVVSVTQESDDVKKEEETSDDVVDTSVQEEKKDTVVENPLFSDGEVSSNEDNTIDESFWFPSDTPDALNELPDLDSSENKIDSNNFFANNNSIPDLSFPDLKVDFGNNDEEAK